MTVDEFIKSGFPKTREQKLNKLLYHITTNMMDIEESAEILNEFVNKIKSERIKETDNP